MTIAEELNQTLDGTAAFRLLAPLGRRMYMPKGLLTQSAEATERAHRFNATIGMAYADGEPMILDAVRAALPGLTPYEAVAYAPTAGLPELRKLWKSALAAKNPSFRGKECSLPVVVPGLTAAVSFIADLFVDAGEGVVVPDLHWPNYRLIIEERKMAKGLTFPLFDGKGFNLRGFEEKLRASAAAKGKAIAVLNFPNNPTGYSPTLAEGEAILAAIGRVADEGADVLIICDDAYFGLAYEADVLAESLFGKLADFHPRVVVAKADGPTKEDYMWGFRTGFVTFAGKGLSAAQLDALSKKVMGVVRSAVSNSPAPAQHIFLKALTEPGYEEQKARYRALLAARYRKARDVLAASALPASLKPLPFNSGYFMSIECEGVSAEKIRLRLLDEGIGVIALGEKHLRIAFSCIEEKDIPDLYAAIFAATKAEGG
ncbi:MAG TPA: aminotransferase class I/II-fold pyridoxal phosphate-dependent enzyme [Rectinemataceae bacterium]|nr:aminotransferase class I/II-fold pyridoxal phosphate-dependent enzyme [Rectinemataceae bacterium]